MANSYCKIILIGYLGREPELRFLPSGDPVCDFTMATTERWQDRAGQAQERTTWFRVSAFGRLAEVCRHSLSTGSQVYVEGPVWPEEYTDRDSVRRTSLQVRAREVRFLDRRSDAGETGEQDPLTTGAAEGAAGGLDVLPL
jgi:single-strand DNA-binding protein